MLGYYVNQKYLNASWNGIIILSSWRDSKDEDISRVYTYTGEQDEQVNLSAVKSILILQ